MRPCQGGSSVACLNLKMSRASVLSHFTLLSVVELKENCLSLSEFNFFQKGCRLSRFYFMCCRYFLDDFACWNLPWQGIIGENHHFLSWPITFKFLQHKAYTYTGMMLSSVSPQTVTNETLHITSTVTSSDSIAHIEYV